MTWEEAVLWLRSQPDQAALVRDCYFDDPLGDAAERFLRSSEWQALRSWLPYPPGRAVDLGAGRGITSYALAREGFRVIAVEPDPSAIVGAGAIRQLAREKGIEIEVSQHPAERLPLASESFELVLGRQVLHHARDLRLLCREAARVLRPGGTFIAAREHVISRREDLPAFLASHPLHARYGGESAFLLSEYREAIEAAGIEIGRVLDPYSSDINLFPGNAEQVKGGIARRLGLPSARWVPDVALRLLAAIDRTPGRLYTFIGRRRRA